MSHPASEARAFRACAGQCRHSRHERVGIADEALFGSVYMSRAVLATWRAGAPDALGTGLVAATLARFFAAKTTPVLIANSCGPETVGEFTAKLGATVKAVTVDEAVEADIIFFAIGSVAVKDVGALLRDWSGKIVIDVTNAFMLPPEAQRAEC